MVDVGQRPAAQDRVAVAAFRETVLGSIHSMRHVQRLTQEFRLVVEMRAWHIFGNFLKQGNVRSFFSQKADHALDTVTAVYAADTLVYVPAYDSEQHLLAKI